MIHYLFVVSKEFLIFNFSLDIILLENMFG